MLSFETFLTIRQNSLYVTVCMIARSSYRGYFIHSLSTLHYYNAPSLATQLTGDYRDRTSIGKCGPALLDTLQRKRTRQVPPLSDPYGSSDFKAHYSAPPEQLYTFLSFENLACKPSGFPYCWMDKISENPAFMRPSRLCPIITHPSICNILQRCYPFAMRFLYRILSDRRYMLSA